MFSISATVLAYLVAIATCDDSTRSVMKCQTRMGESRATSIASHTETRTIIAPAITIGFTSTPVETMYPIPFTTVTAIRTSTSTSISSIIAPVPDDGTWTTTRTNYLSRVETWDHVTVTTTGAWQNTMTETFYIFIPTSRGFLFANTTTSAATQRVATSVADSETLYVMRDGQPIPIFMTAFEAQATSLPETSSLLDMPTQTEEDVVFHKRAALPATRGPGLLGLRGIMASDTMDAVKAFPTMVRCTKKVIREHTHYDVRRAETSTLYQSYPTTTVWSTIQVVSYVTIPTNPVTHTSTATITVATLVIPKTWTGTVTVNQGIDLTMTSTRTLYDACATPNQIGPILSGGRRVNNVYNRGLDSFAAFDIGYAQSPEDCCVECMTEQGCTGSVYEHGRGSCMLLVGAETRDACPSQDPAAAFYVAAQSPARQHADQFWPEFVVSNGPCGIISDGGRGD